MLHCFEIPSALELSRTALSCCSLFFVQSSRGCSLAMNKELAIRDFVIIFFQNEKSVV